jgi:hypothetical protein
VWPTSHWRYASTFAIKVSRRRREKRETSRHQATNSSKDRTHYHAIKRSTAVFAESMLTRIPSQGKKKQRGGSKAAPVAGVAVDEGGQDASKAMMIQAGVAAVVAVLIFLVWQTMSA